MSKERFPWKNEYQFVAPNINADGVYFHTFDPSFPVDTVFLATSGCRVVRMNRHEFFEILYIYSGNTEMRIRNHRIPLTKGDFVVIGPHIYHCLWHEPHVEVKRISFIFLPEAIGRGEVEGEDAVYLSPFLGQDPQFPHVISGNGALSREVLDLILKVYRELPARTALHRLTARTYMKVLLLHLVRHFADHLETRQVIDRKQKDAQRLRPLFQLLEERYGQRIEVRDGAKACAMSASHFMRFFKSTTGQSFNAYVTGFRIARAQSMLSSSDVSIAEISQRVGFCSQSYFGEVFRVLAGMTPRAYRRQFGPKFQLQLESSRQANPLSPKAGASA